MTEWTTENWIPKLAKSTEEVEESSEEESGESEEPDGDKPGDGSTGQE